VQTGGSIRVILEPRTSDPNIWVARCLETGDVTTGLGYEEAREGILDILRTESRHAADQGRSLDFIEHVPAELESKWKAVTSERAPEIVQLFPPPKKRPTRAADVQVARSIG
jgi:hypothetical protein